MDAHLGWEKVLDWLVSHSLQAGLLVLLVVLVQWVFRRQLTHRWRFALWWIVLARLLLPFSPASPLSLFNLAQPNVRLEISQRPAETKSDLQSRDTAKNSSTRIEPESVSSAPSTVFLPATPSRLAQSAPHHPPTPPAPAAKSVAMSPHHAWTQLALPVLAVFWLVGVAGLSFIVVLQLSRFQRKLARGTYPADPLLQSLLEDCQREFRISRRIELVETDADQSPALFGLFRLQLLLPPRMKDKFSTRELRYVFLHELAHVKRGDLWLNWLVTVLQILHWFNPLLWIGFARLRADRELACDELALLHSDDTAGTAYGETVVKLLEYLNQPAAIPGLIGILEDQKQMHRRISMIANFRRPSRWSTLAVVLIAALAAAALTDAQSTNSTTIKGVVLNNEGLPVTERATVFIATAGPKTGTSTFCPSCYADCAKHAQTDAQGIFKIDSLDPQLTFKLLAVAKGFQPQYVSNVDPARGRTVRIRLKPIESSDAAPDRSVRGRVIDPKGNPIAGAVVEVQGTEDKTGGRSWGMLAGVDPLAVTDSQGEFLLTAKNPFQAMSVKVEARTYADKLFIHLESGGAHHELVMTEGATLTGRLVLDGKPLAAVSVGISGVDRQMEHYLGNFNVATGSKGNFAFLNLPPDADFSIYTTMDSMKRFGAISLRQIHVGKDGETTDVGDLVATPAHRLAGRVVLSDGKPVPANTRISIGRDAAWDDTEVSLDENGYFETTGVPSETITLSVRIKGYHPSAKNLSLDRLNPFRLIGRVDHDITSLVFLLENGSEVRPDYQADNNETQQSPLSGVEGKPDHSRDWTFSGRVLESESKQPVPSFRVTPGQTDNFDQTTWITAHAVDGTNGVYSVYVGKRVSQPVLKVEAEGYLPQSVPLLPGGATNVDFNLQKGSGPTGSVLNPDGKPAVGAKVALLDSGWRLPSLSADGELRSQQQEPDMVTAVDEKGSFILKPQLGMKSLVAASSNGFAAVTLAEFAASPIITLKPYGKITGTLQRTSGPGTNEILDLTFSSSEIPELARFSLFSLATTTDPQGKFGFDHIPPGQFQLSYRVPMNQSQSWMNQPLQVVDLSAGQALAITITTTNRIVNDDSNFHPPPPPVMIPGAQIKGVVLLPNGKPASNAEVALQIENVYLALAKGTFSRGSMEEGWRGRTGPDGSFALPMYEKTQSIIALNDEGYAQVSLEQLKSSPKITLQKWGTIEGVLHVGHRLGTNEQIDVEESRPKWNSLVSSMEIEKTNSVTMAKSSAVSPPPLPYAFNAFQTKTDNHGHFVVTFVPPGKSTITRFIASGPQSGIHMPVAEAEVKPGMTLVTNLGGNGRTVIGKAKFTDRPSPIIKNRWVNIETPSSKLVEKLNTAKNIEERSAIYNSDEYQAALKAYRNYYAVIQPDSSFKAEDVLPGTYEANFEQYTLTGNTTAVTRYTAKTELIVPELTDKDDDSPVNWGDVELKKLTVPVPKPANAEK